VTHHKLLQNHGTMSHIVSINVDLSESRSVAMVIIVMEHTWGQLQAGVII